MILFPSGRSTLFSFIPAGKLNRDDGASAPLASPASSTSYATGPNFLLDVDFFAPFHLVLLITHSFNSVGLIPFATASIIHQHDRIIIKSTSRRRESCCKTPDRDSPPTIAE